MEKKTPPAKTPANNAGSGATADRLRVPEHDFDKRDLLDTAEVFVRSGWFGALTTYQVAVLILTGQSLGLDAAQSVFDLEITAADGETPANVAYREKRAYRAAADRIDALRAGNGRESGNKDVPGDAATPDPAVSEQTPPPEPEKSNVVQLRPPAVDDAEPGVTDPAAAAGNADEDVARSADEQAPADRVAMAPDPTAGEAGKQRKEIADRLSELGFSFGDIKTRIDKFDASPTSERVKMFNECRRYYDKKVGDLRYSIVQRLAEDGKRTTEQQAGFYLYADVPTDPTEWNYAIAKKAADALDGFLKRK